MRRSLLLCLLLLSCAPQAEEQKTHVPLTLIAPAALTHLSFSGSIAGEHVEGVLRDAQIILERDKEHPDDFTQASIRATVHILSLEMSATALRDRLLSEAFLDAQKFPLVTFVSKDVAAMEEFLAYTVTGSLTLHGETRDVAFASLITEGFIAGEATLDPASFGIGEEGSRVSVLVKGVFLQDE